MKITPYILAVLALFTMGQAPVSKSGSITGRVVLALDGQAVKQPDDVWVYLEEKTPKRLPGVGFKVVITQRSQEFQPHVMLIPAGATVGFPNKDATDHSVFSPASAISGLKWDGFDLGTYGKSNEGRSRKFLRTGEFDVFCDKHMNMWAKVKVVPSTYYAAVGKDGAFKIAGVPPGTYRVWAWAPQSKDVASEELTITGDETKSVPELHVQSTPRPVVHTRSDGSQYDYSQYKPRR